MKATGIVRRIDDLGRVVIPKEIRRTLRIREGDPLEIYTEKDGEVIFKKYSLMGGLADFAGQMCESMHRSAERPALICDRDSVIAVSGLGRRELMGRRISAELEKLMDDRKAFRAERGVRPVPLLEGAAAPAALAAAPIISEGDVIGCVMFAAAAPEDSAGDVEYKLVQTVSTFLGKQMES